MADTNNERVDKALDLLKEAICGGLSLLSREQDIFAFHLNGQKHNDSADIRRHFR